MRFQVLLSLWSVTSWLCIDKIPEVAKTKVSKPKRYSLSKLRFCHAPLKRLIQTRPHMSTSRRGNICIMPPKCSCKERRRGFSNCSSKEYRSPDWPIRVDWACRKEGLCRKRSVWERRGIMCFLNIKACQHILLHQIHKIMIFKKASYDPFKSNDSRSMLQSSDLNQKTHEPTPKFQSKSDDFEYALSRSESNNLRSKVPI